MMVSPITRAVDDDGSVRWQWDTPIGPLDSFLHQESCLGLTLVESRN